MAGSAEGFQFKITNLDENYKKYGLTEREIAARKLVNLRPWTLKMVYNWIDSMEMDPAIKAELKTAAGRYPQQALGRFVEAYDGILAAIIKTRREKIRDNSIKESRHEKEDIPSVRDFPRQEDFS